MLTLAGHAAASVDMVPHVATLTRMARRARTVVEFGVRTGVSTWAILDGLPSYGHLASYDIADVLSKVPDRVRDDPRWTFIQQDDRLGVDHLDADLVFIDTSHEYHHTLAELEIAGALGAEWILLHDYALPDVADAVHGFVRRGVYRVALIEPSTWGLVGLTR